MKQVLTDDLLQAAAWKVQMQMLNSISGMMIVNYRSLLYALKKDGTIGAPIQE